MNSKMNGEVDEMMEVVLDKVMDEEANKKSKIWMERNVSPYTI